MYLYLIENNVKTQDSWHELQHHDLAKFHILSELHASFTAMYLSLLINNVRTQVSSSVL